MEVMQRGFLHLMTFVICFGSFRILFLNDLIVFDDIDGDVVIDETEDVQVNVLDRAFYLDDVLYAHFVALGILDDGNGAVKFVESQVMIDSPWLLPALIWSSTKPS